MYGRIPSNRNRLDIWGALGLACVCAGCAPQVISPGKSGQATDSGAVVTTAGSGSDASSSAMSGPTTGPVGTTDGVPCPRNTPVLCGETCVDTNTDSLNCGACDLGCNVPGSTCVMASCSTRSWVGAESIGISPESGLELADVQAVVSQGGDGLIVWQQRGTPSYGLWTNRYWVARRSWVGPQLIVSASVREPQLATAGDGDTLLVWRQQQPDQFDFDLWSCRYDAAAQQWLAPERLELDAADVYAADIGGDDNGRPVVVWHQAPGTWARRYDPAEGTWNAPALLEVDLAPLRPAVVVDGIGSDNVIAVWAAATQDQHSVHASRYDAIADAWSEVLRIDQGIVGDAQVPRTAGDDNGNAIVVWQVLNTDGVKIYANRYDASSAQWGSAEALGDGRQNATRPFVAMAPQGRAVVVWFQDNGDEFDIWAQHYEPATQDWGRPQLIEMASIDPAFPPDPGDSYPGGAIYPQVAVDGSGNARATWYQNSGTWASAYTVASASWGAPERIEAVASPRLRAPQLAMNLAGEALVTWVQGDPGLPELWANRLR